MYESIVAGGGDEVDADVFSDYVAIGNGVVVVVVVVVLIIVVVVAVVVIVVVSILACTN